jgi:hypothetical protein
MGRLPTTYAGKPIYNRDPYVLYGELAVTSAQISTEYPQATFSCQTTKPLEMHRLKPWLVALDAEDVPLATQPDQDLLASLIRISVKKFDQEQSMTRVPVRISALVKGTAERTWEWADPSYLECSTGFTVSITPVTFPVIQDLASILVCVSIQGYMIQLKAPDNT